MIKKIRIIENIFNFEVQSRLIIALSGEVAHRNLLIFDGNMWQLTELLIDVLLPSIKKFDNKIWAFSKNLIFEFDIDNGFSLSNQFKDFYPKFIKDDLLIGDSKKGESRFLEARNAETHVVWQIDFTSTIYYVDEYIYLVRFTETLAKYSISAVVIRSGLLVWEYTIPETKYDWFNLGNVYISERAKPIKAEIKKILGVYDKVLYITLNSGVILGLDENTGEERISISMPSIYPHQWSEDEVKIYTNDLISGMDKDNGLLFGLRHNYYGEIDLKSSNKIYTIVDIYKMDPEKVDLRLGCWNDFEIFFFDWSFAQDPARVGVFDRTSREITWVSSMLGEDGIFKGVNKVEYSENRLYVLDRAQTLHVFERGPRG